MRNPKVCVAMPVYNGANYLHSAIESVLAQEYDNVEAIVVNDGSADEGATAAVGQRYAETYPGRVRYIEQSNKGVGGALNTAIRHMDGDFFSWLSHDDLFEPHKTRVQVDFYHQLARRNAMIFSDFTVINAAGVVTGATHFDKNSFLRAPRLPIYRGCLNGCTVLIPLYLLNGHNPFRTDKRYAQDYWLFYELLKHNEFYFIPKPLVRYRRHSEQDTHKPAATAEGEEIWRHMVDSTSELDRVQLYGSTWRFYDETFGVIDPSPYRQTARYLAERRDRCISEALVSVVIPFYNEVRLVRRALASVLCQSHGNIQVILVDDGSTEPLDELIRAVSHDERVTLVHQPNSGPGAARNYGLRMAKGDYIAFLDADDVFLPQKIERQLVAMAKKGERFSHTSYFISLPEARADFGQVYAGRFTGDVYPEVLKMCPVLTSTVMLHRSLLAEGFEFPTDTFLCEDVLAWIWVAARMPIHGIDELLTVFEGSSNTASLNLRKSCDGLAYLIERLASDPLHRRFEMQLSQLRQSHAACADRIRSGATLNNDLMTLWFSCGGKTQYLPALAEAQSGQVEFALSSFKRYLDECGDDPIVAYWYGSCLAWLGDYDSANDVFGRPLHIPLQTGKTTSTHIIRFSDLAHERERSSPPRSITFGGVDLKEMASVDFVQMVACDSNYFRRFVAASLHSTLRNGGVRIGFHVHIVNPDADTNSALDRLTMELDAPLGWSFEHLDMSTFNQSAQATYLACSRFLIASQVVDRYEKPLLVTDADQLVVRSLDNLLASIAGKDVGVIVMEDSAYNVLSLVPANVVILNFTPGAYKFLDALSTYLEARVCCEQDLMWHLDQAALAVCILQLPDKIQLARLPPFILQSTLAREREETVVLEKTIFWTINFSIPQNSAKLDWDAFAKYAKPKEVLYLVDDLQKTHAESQGLNPRKQCAFTSGMPSQSSN